MFGPIADEIQIAMNSLKDVVSSVIGNDMKLYRIMINTLPALWVMLPSFDFAVYYDE